ncbi:unnamed protein product [Arabidopsis thaliana]|uniref:Large ribosomal RNA subunit accumulation protein YCED homolog 1, chloroplastic n=3 Tax=Arabidopsis TaxID=3701 RepID=YCED1_ARATH|nr:BTB/POZ domain protein, putative (DUF177) [Arabidopsis thaliana]NP_566649.1 BTB/POZ domain protein, putative (DUF177) [Arabidopsis thaliana]Q9LT27.1 RecName: Full=Large ribosomal RNA subunit accumulation protein YCED homolog 1, chloroplastic; AltName: Full=23S rRNA accumulation protein YCED; AltName: Full=Protein DUF177A; Flags: Precursor [Arabidopsis thaliana]KAG7631876.1 Large ribosomal RNA subunit accumulation protein YceD [Arabidopsis suecica]AAM65741.1 unknown [Arabidopsis thaliana]ABG|eukprot:NP_001327235.1 BTB/POZ domain protein, putative (DUF177) [Arabidopsis thaliana]
MSLVCSLSCVAPLPQTKQSRPSFLKLETCTLSLSSPAGYPNFTTGIRKHISYLFTEPIKLPRLAKSRILVSQESFTETSTIDMDWEDQEEIEDTGSPWEGSVMYRRNASVTHVEYCTTLERLGLGRLSTDVSKKRASAMGLRVTKDVKDYPDGTPVQVSVDVIRKKKKLRLDGIVRTVITLGCNRCGESTGESIFSNFSLLLTEEPVEEPDVIDLGFTFGNDKEEGEDDDDNDDSWIDWEDKLHFPPEVKEIDISKHIRDLVHLEITITAICDSACKGMCLKCGANLNKRKCDCGREEKDKGYGPLGNLREQMQQKEGLRN